ncbi:MAG: NUDIX hydrolase [Lachnospiraceae bacterium]|nr:NUDIX hydrolase [Lachnospiraceae bacterium]
MQNPCTDKDLIWTPIREEHLIRDRWIDLRRMEYRFPDGKTFGPYYNYSRRSYVVILASDEEGRFICVRQYRHGIGQVTTEFPAGGIERTGAAEYVTREDARSTAEDAFTAARRELEEETGYTSSDWSHMITVPSNATIADNYAYIYRAKNCRRTCAPHPDDIEYLQMTLLSAQEIDELIRQGRFQQAIHVMAWYMDKCGQ